MCRGKGPRLRTFLFGRRAVTLVSYLIRVTSGQVIDNDKIEFFIFQQLFWIVFLSGYLKFIYSYYCLVDYI